MMRGILHRRHTDGTTKWCRFTRLMARWPPLASCAEATKGSCLWACGRSGWRPLLNGQVVRRTRETESQRRLSISSCSHWSWRWRHHLCSPRRVGRTALPSGRTTAPKGPVKNTVVAPSARRLRSRGAQATHRAPSRKGRGRDLLAGAGTHVRPLSRSLRTPSMRHRPRGRRAALLGLWRTEWIPGADLRLRHEMRPRRLHR
jgi:hypothetical protein